MSVIIASGGAVLRRDRAGRVFFAGVGGSADGDRPFLELRSLFPRSLAAPPQAPPLSGAAGEGKEGRVQDALPHGQVEQHTASLRLWRCQVGVYEAIQNVIQPEPVGGPGPGSGAGGAGSDAGGDSFILLTTAETPYQPPQLMERVVVIGDRGEEGAAAEAITALPHPQPALVDVKKELIKYTRGLDGLELSGMLYTPAGYDVSRYMTVSYKLCDCIMA